jgi:predicted RNase H-like HicB family nuclease
MSEPKYTVIIQWSDEDDAYVVSLPEWGCKTHGRTYDEAAKHAREVLELLMETHDVRARGPLPKPKLFHYPGAEVVDLKQDSKPEERSAVA